MGIVEDAGGEDPGQEKESLRREETVPLQVEVPDSLRLAMRGFLERHPNWDQHRLLQVALAGFLVQNGSQDRAVIRCYLANLFPKQTVFANQEPASLARQRLARRSREAA